MPLSGFVAVAKRDIPSYANDRVRQPEVERIRQSITPVREGWTGDLLGI